MKRKRKIILYLLAPVLVVAAMVIFFVPGGCKKDIMIPYVETTNISSVTETTFTGGGRVASDGGDDGTTRGICWSTSTNPTIVNSKTTDGHGSGTFTSTATGLAPSTIYYVRAYAINSAGLAYGAEVQAVTSHPWSGTVKDIDSNSYHTIIIGTREWMGQNLKTTRLNDGTPVYKDTVINEWATAINPYYCYNGNNEANKDVYGALYNGYAVLSGKLCPKGWHLPSDHEWQTLITYLGDSLVAGDKMKEGGTMHWSSATSATNESGFTGLPGGYLGSYYYGGGGGCDAGIMNGSFMAPGYLGVWWSDTRTYSDTMIYTRQLRADNTGVFQGTNNIKDGASVRCIKD